MTKVLSSTTSDEICCGSSTQKFDGANSKKEKYIDSSEEISTDLYIENAMHQNLSYSIKRNVLMIIKKIVFMRKPL